MAISDLLTDAVPGSRIAAKRAEGDSCNSCWAYIVLVTSQYELNSSTLHPGKTSLWLLSVPSILNPFNGIVLYHESLHLFHVKQKINYRQALSKLLKCFPTQP